jgi:Zn-dependent membrane protease YugP
MYWDSTYILVLVGFVLCLIASARVKTTFAKYSKVRSMSGCTGAEAADRILHMAGIYDVRIEHVNGNLTDHYDPRNKVLRLSDSVYGQTSVAAIGVAAHECGHAIQHAKGYVPLAFRSSLAPAASFASNAAWPIIIVGFIFGLSRILLPFGIILFSVAVLFQIVTLPVEYNASNRAIRILADTGILYQDELKQSKKVLKAAALTYVAATAASILQLIRLILLSRRN